MGEMEVWQLLLIVLGPTGSVWFSAKAALNGIREDVKQIKGDVRNLRDGQQKNREEIVRLQEHHK